MGEAVEELPPFRIVGVSEAVAWLAERPRCRRLVERWRDAAVSLLKYYDMLRREVTRPMRHLATPLRDAAVFIIDVCTRNGGRMPLYVFYAYMDEAAKRAGLSYSYLLASQLLKSILSSILIECDEEMNCRGRGLTGEAVQRLAALYAELAEGARDGREDEDAVQA